MADNVEIVGTHNKGNRLCKLRFSGRWDVSTMNAIHQWFFFLTWWSSETLAKLLTVHFSQGDGVNHVIHTISQPSDSAVSLVSHRPIPKSFSLLNPSWSVFPNSILLYVFSYLKLVRGEDKTARTCVFGINTAETSARFCYLPPTSLTANASFIKNIKCRSPPRCERVQV